MLMKALKVVFVDAHQMRGLSELGCWVVII